MAQGETRRASIPRRIHGVSCLLAVLIAVGSPARCDEGKGQKGAGDQDRTIQVGSLKRTYRLHAPAGAGGSKPVPVVFMLHGGFGTGPGLQEIARMDPVADREGFLVVYPNGVARGWNAGECCGRPQRENVDDVGFVIAMIRDLKGDFKIDEARIFAAGISNGAMMAYRLACDIPDKIAAVAAVSGPLRTSPCKPSRPISIIHFHGTADKRILWNGGVGANKATGRNPSIPEIIEGWVKRDGCSESATEVYSKGDVVCQSYGSCREGAEVRLCKVEGGGHQWPGGEPFMERMLGHTTQNISASETMWKFFEAHPMTGK